MVTKQQHNNTSTQQHINTTTQQHINTTTHQHILMDQVRVMLLSALVLMLLVLGRCSRVQPVSRPLKTRTETETENRTRTSRDGMKSLEKESRSDQGLEAHPRDPRHKEKFIRHLTGPLNFTPKCRKHFYRLYYSTRDCTIPAYYKRCARLLTRLANSPRCAQR